MRFRILDPDCALLPAEGEQDITLTQDAFSSLALPATKVFITENEINFLAFPNVSDGMVIFGGGYGFDNLAAASWLHQKKLYYWGDIDTHGFCILNQLRGFFPHAISFLMDRQTLLGHRPLWGVEDRPERGSLGRLDPAESSLYDELRLNTLGDRVRLEQERIGFDFLREVLKNL
ncbi:hypothetical protein MASR2M79_06780 [Aminivibrio sp.]